MTEKNARTRNGTAPLRGAELRDARLKAALKANMARRKAQARQRGAGEGAGEGVADPHAEPPPQPDAGARGLGNTAAGPGAQDKFGAQEQIGAQDQAGAASDPGMRPEAISGNKTQHGSGSATPGLPDTGSGA